MKTFKTIICAVLLIVGSQTTLGQMLNSAYFTDGFALRHTMNPAYDNSQSYFSIPALGNINVSMQGNFGLKDVIMDNPLRGMTGEKSLTTFLNPNISAADALSGFNKGGNKLTEDLNLSIFSAGFKGFGGFNTIEFNVRQTLGVSLPYELMEFAKNIGNKSYTFDDISVGAQAYAELAFGHSHQVNKKLRVGAKAKV